MLFDLFACTFITPLLGYIIQWYHLPVLLQLKQSGKKIPFWLSAALCCFYYRWTRKQCWAKRYLSFLSVLARHYFRAWQLPVFVQQFSYLKITNKNPSNSIPSTISKVRKQKNPKQTNQPTPPRLWWFYTHQILESLWLIPWVFWTTLLGCVCFLWI